MKKSEKEFELILQLHGGGHSGGWVGKQVKKVTSSAAKVAGKVLGGGAAEGAAQATEAKLAPTITAAQATEGYVGDEMDTYKSRLRKAKGKNYTDQTGGYAQGIKKSLLGE